MHTLYNRGLKLAARGPFAAPLIKFCGHHLGNTDSDVQIPKKKTSDGQQCFSHRGARV